MSMQDPIADMLTRIRNAQMVEKFEVEILDSKLNRSIASVLKAEGYINDFRNNSDSKHPTMIVSLKYFDGRPVIDEIKRVSRPGLRVYKGKNELPVVKNGLGIAIISTAHGVMSDQQARRLGHGGEVICTVS